ncbi:uncharacterized protein STEHIDRAFT_146152 [Stereum hirsutum FP-91666 SS1]|uniref:uncharacterized protein n=1 Tax=Stereum hirsutum (strain FP-91666) TaxID=721885 RepID=UPI0004410229|nr:uncharacterized protein STEHIDRAFT_146152 [Stereum hirsutum FP-91666 SS1]EIM88039.1 hypothetical protein STEHIDRAFT_146152 [Stereum hirsutum FP-91666 SS1]
MALESPGLTRLRRFTVTLVYRNLGFLFEVLKSMTGLIHLSILLPHVALDHANSSNLHSQVVAPISSNCHFFPSIGSPQTDWAGSSLISYPRHPPYAVFESNGEGGLPLCHARWRSPLVIKIPRFFLLWRLSFGAYCRPVIS